MDAMKLLVRPVAGGWIVEASAGLAPLAFQTGGTAERKAAQLAQAIAATGADAKVTVLDHAGQLVGARWFWAEDRTVPQARSPGATMR